MPDFGGSRWWTLRNAILGGSGTVAVGVVLLALGAHIPFLQAAPKEPDGITDIQQEVAALDVWSGPPETYVVGDLKATVADAVTSSTGELVAMTPPELWRRGPKFAGRPVFLVGQVRERASRLRRFIPREEIVVAGRDQSYRVFLATNNPALFGVHEGDLVYALGYLVATGRGEGLRVGYFVTVEASGAGDVSGLDPSNHVAKRAHDATFPPS